MTVKRGVRQCGISLFFKHECDGNLSSAKTVALHQNNPLPFSQQRLPIFHGQQQRCSNQGGEDVIRDVRGIVRMSIVKFGNYRIEGVKKVQIRSRSKSAVVNAAVV